jgi:hypothetical protein
MCGRQTRGKQNPAENGRAWFASWRTCCRIGPGYFPCIETHVLSAAAMKIFVKAILPTPAFPFPPGVTAASLSTVAHTYAVCTRSGSGTNSSYDRSISMIDDL